MDSHTQKLVEGLKSHPGMVQGILQSPDGQELLRRLSAQDGGKSLQKATLSAARGDTSQLVQLISGLMQSPEGEALVQRIHSSVNR